MPLPTGTLVCGWWLHLGAVVKHLAPEVVVAAEEAFVSQTSVRIAREALQVSPAVVDFYQGMSRRKHLPALGIDAATLEVSRVGWEWLQALQQRADVTRRVCLSRTVKGAPSEGTVEGRPVSLEAFFDLE